MISSGEEPPPYNPKSADAVTTTFRFPQHRFFPEDDGPPSLGDSSDQELPPAYTTLDEGIHTYSIHAPFVYGISSSFLPRYQFSTQFTRSGRPFRLRIRRLLATESRILSRDFSSHGKCRLLDFDEDMTLYLVDNVAALNLLGSSTVEIRGRQARTLGGSVKMQQEGRKCCFWHITRNSANDALKKENAAKIQRYGYRPDDEINKRLLFYAQKKYNSANIEWKDEGGGIVAVEIADSLELSKDIETKTREMLLTCWAAKKWSNGTLKSAIPDG